MQDDIKEFFESFATDVSTFDGKVIASRYIAPYTVVSQDGDLWLCATHDDIIDYFQNLLDRHKDRGVVACKSADIDFASVGEGCYMASVTWTMVDDKGEAVSHWRESYNLIQKDGLKIFTSIDH